MTQPGMGAMLHMLGGGSDHDPSEYAGKRIASAFLDEVQDRVIVTFDDGKIIHIWDDGQSCCESRYITCDDDFSKIIGGTFVGVETKPADDVVDGEWGDVHEQVFVDLKSSSGTVTFTTHNEHNGYYGGFGLTITEPQ